jgi:hypothetical protein
MIIAAALVEGVALFGLVICILLATKAKINIPFLRSVRKDFLRTDIQLNF